MLGAVKRPVLRLALLTLTVLRSRPWSFFITCLKKLGFVDDKWGCLDYLAGGWNWATPKPLPRAFTPQWSEKSLKRNPQIYIKSLMWSEKVFGLHWFWAQKCVQRRDRTETTSGDRGRAAANSDCQLDRIQTEWRAEPLGIPWEKS